MRIVRETGKPISQVARELVPALTLYIELGVPDAHEIRIHLKALKQSP